MKTNVPYLVFHRTSSPIGYDVRFSHKRHTIITNLVFLNYPRVQIRFGSESFEMIYQTHDGSPRARCDRHATVERSASETSYLTERPSETERLLRTLIGRARCRAVVERGSSPCFEPGVVFVYPRLSVPSIRRIPREYRHERPYPSPWDYVASNYRIFALSFQRCSTEFRTIFFPLFFESHQRNVQTDLNVCYLSEQACVINRCLPSNESGSMSDTVIVYSACNDPREGNKGKKKFT